MPFLKSLKIMQTSIHKSRESVEKMKATSLNNLGIQRTLNQSIRFLDTDLKTFLEIMDFISGSIDKITSKSKFLVGDIDFAEQ